MVDTAAPLHSAPVTGSYWEQSRGPLASLAFVAPLLVVYEGGVLFAGPQALRNGADVWLRQFLDLLGFGNYFLLPALTAGILLGWHHTTSQPWRLSRRVLGGMAVECGGLAICLVLIAHLQSALLGAMAAGNGAHGMPADAADCAIRLLRVGGGSGGVGRLVAYLGAGIYEELLFRLILLSLLAWALKALGARRDAACAAAVALTSLAFSLAHYVGPHGEALHLHSFVFRFVAGIFFAVLFVFRGFGIAAGTHAAYDVLVGLLL